MISQDKEILNISNLESGYGSSIVLQNINLWIRSGESYSVLGKNGMGKSTFLKTIMGFISPRNGDIELYGQLLYKVEPEFMAKNNVAYISQEKSLFQDMTVKDNLLLALSDTKLFDNRFKEIEDYFPIIKKRLNQKAGTLSGGEQKMLLVARALIIHPRLILIDEITEGMQPSVINQLTLILREHQEKYETSILIVEQNIQFALDTSDKFAIMELGQIVEIGATNEENAYSRIAHYFTV